MNARVSIGSYAARFDCSPGELTRPLPEVGSRLQGQLEEISRRPTPDGAERLALELEGVRRHVLRLRAVLLQGAGNDGPHPHD